MEFNYNKLLSDMADAFLKKEMALVLCLDSHDNEEIVLAKVTIDPVSQNLDVMPYAKFWYKNPLAGLTMTEYPIIAIQKPLTQWNKDAKISVCDYKILN